MTEVKNWKPGTIGWSLQIWEGQSEHDCLPLYLNGPEAHQTIREEIPGSSVAFCEERYGLRIWVPVGGLKQAVEFLSKNCLFKGFMFIQLGLIADAEPRPNGMVWYPHRPAYLGPGLKQELNQIGAHQINKTDLFKVHFKKAS